MTKQQSSEQRLPEVGVSAYHDDPFVREHLQRAIDESKHWEKLNRQLDIGHAILDGCLWFMGILLVGWIVFGIVGVANGYIR